MNDLPIRLFNSVDTPTEVVIHPADAEAENALWQWAPSRVAAASAVMLGPVVVRGLECAIWGVDVENRPRIGVEAGIAAPVESYGRPLDPTAPRFDVPYSRRGELRARLLQGLEIERTGAILIAASAVEAETASNGRHDLRIELIQLDRVERLEPDQSVIENYYYAPPTVMLDALAPLAIVDVVAPGPSLPMGAAVAISDMRQLLDGWLVREWGQGFEWTVPFRAYTPTQKVLDDFLTENENQQLSNHEGEWTQVGSMGGEFEPSRSGAWIACPIGFEIEIHGRVRSSLSTLNKRKLLEGNEYSTSLRHTMSFAPMLDGQVLDDSAAAEVNMFTIAGTASLVALLPGMLTDFNWRVVPQGPGIHHVSVGVKVESDGYSDTEGTAGCILHDLVIWARRVRSVDVDG